MIYNIGIDKMKNTFKDIDQITQIDIQNLSKKIFSKPSIIGINANKDVINQNKDYLSSLGEIIL